MNHDSLIDDEAIVCVIPFVPVKRKPCDRDGKNSDELNVDDAVEKRPLWNPMVVDVALYEVKAVNGNADDAPDDPPTQLPLIA